MPYRHHLAELAEAYQNVNPDQAILVAAQALRLIREDRIGGLVRTESERDKFRKLEQESLRRVRSLRAGTEALVWPERANDFLLGLEKHFAEIEERLKVLERTKDLSPQGKVDLSHYRLFLAVIWQSLRKPQNRRVSLDNDTLATSYEFSCRMCQEAAGLDPLNWSARSYQARAQRLLGRLASVNAAQCTPTRSDFMRESYAALVGGIAAALSYATDSRRAAGEETNVDQACIEVGQFMNDIGRTFEVHFAAMDELERATAAVHLQRNLSVRGLTREALSQLGSKYQEDPRLKSLVAACSLGLFAAEGRLLEWAYVTLGGDFDSRKDYQVIKEVLGFDGCGLLWCYLSYDATSYYLRTFPEALVGSEASCRLRKQRRPSEVGLVAPMHNQARLATALALHLNQTVLHKYGRSTGSRRANMLISLARGFESSALDLYRQTLSIEPKYAVARENYTLLLLLRGENDQAAREVARIEEIYKGHGSARQDYMVYGIGAILNQQNLGDKRLADYLTEARTVDGQAPDTLTVLKRWNSYTPSIPTKEQSLGGGYMLCLGGVGIAIDPGFSFLRNLRAEGFSLLDIQHVLITHVHSDHWHDLEDLLLLRYEITKRLEIKTELLHIWAAPEVSERIHRRLMSMHYNRIWRHGVFVLHTLDGNSGSSNGPRWKTLTASKVYPPKGKVQIKWTPAWHCGEVGEKDPLECVASGFLVRYECDSKSCTIGFTGDSAWWQQMDAPTTVAEPFYHADVLVAHLGKVYLDDILTLHNFCEIDIPEPKTGFLTEQKSHLGYAGLWKTLREVADKRKQMGMSGPDLFLVSEFGEELGRFRLAVGAQLQKCANLRDIGTCVAAGDTGQRYYLPMRPVSGSARKREKDKIPAEFRCSYCGSESRRPLGQLCQSVQKEESGDLVIVDHCARHCVPEPGSRRFSHEVV